MNILRHLSWHSYPSADSIEPVAQPKDYNNLRRSGTPSRVSPGQAAPGQSRGHAIMTKGLPSKPISSSWRAGRSSAPSREPRITNHPLASHQSRQTTTAKESTTSPRAPRPTRPRRVTLAVVTGTRACPSAVTPYRHLQPRPASGLGPRPMQLV